MTTQTTDRQAVPSTEVGDTAAYAPMADYIIDTTAAWWSYLTGLAPHICRERFTTEDARGVALDVYTHQVENGANEPDAIATAGTVVVRSTIDNASDEHVAMLTAELRDHVRRSITQD